MLDIKFIRENADLVKRVAAGKRVEVDIDKLLKLDERRREHLHKLETLKAKHNQESKGRKGKPTREEIEAMRQRAEEIKTMEQAQSALQAEYDKMLWEVPNIVHKSVLEGKDETQNKVVRSWGKPLKFNFKPKEHWELGAALGIMDSERASHISGSRFTYFKGKLVLLQFALIHWAFSVLTDEKILAAIAKKAKLKVSPRPFIPVIPPMLMRPEVMHKMARLEPREERYHIEKDDLYLIGSSEHTLGPLHMNEILSEEDLPIRYVGFSTCFRREAGTYGKDTKGAFRMHQFDKVEMESFGKPEQGIAEQDFFIAIQEYFMQELGLPYQVVFKFLGDMGAPDFREFDIEAWMPGQGKYRETHTADYMADYQARRLNIKYRFSSHSEEPRGDEESHTPHKSGGSLAESTPHLRLRRMVRGQGMAKREVDFVHMNDATAIALSRTPIAIMENFQQKDGSIKVPDVLVSYCGFKTITR